MTSLMKRELCRTTNDNNFTALSSFVSGITSLLFDKKKNAYPIMLKFMFNKFNAPWNLNLIIDFDFVNTHPKRTKKKEQMEIS